MAARGGPNKIISQSIDEALQHKARFEILEQEIRVDCKRIAEA